MKNGFQYKVTSFEVDGIKEINKELMARDIDATDIISIIKGHSYDHWYEVFYKEKVN